MKVVILAGGYGTRISEESYMKPKPMIEIGDRPILWHIMKLYSNYGFNEFIICAGYKQHIIKEWFSNYCLYSSDITFDFRKDCGITVHNRKMEDWTVTIVDTGLNTMTGGRIKRIQKYVGEEPFLLTYGDGVSDINIEDTIKFHKENGGVLTLTAVQPEGRFGMLEIEENKIYSFREKNVEDTGWINAGFMVVEPQIFNYIKGDTTIFEREPLEELANTGLLTCYRHYGFWQCMDTIRDKQKLDEMWENNMAPWKKW